MLLALLALFWIAASAQAATVISFHRIAQGSALTITNPQPSVVTGTIRTLAAPGATEGPHVSFTLQAGQSRAFGNLLASTSSTLPAAIVAVEATDLVTVGAHALQLAFAARPAQTTILHDPSTGRTGTLMLGLMGEVQVSVYASQSAPSPLVTKTYRSFGAEQTLRLSYAQLLGTVPVLAGVVRVIPITGTAVVAAENPPMRRRPSDPRASPVARISAAGTACVSQSGFELRTTPAADEYQWTLYGAAAPSTTSSAVHALPSAPGYMSVALRTRTGAVHAFGNATVQVGDRPSVDALHASDATPGQQVVIRWSATGAGAGVLTGTDFPTSGAAVDLASGEYRYTATETGAKSVRLDAENACGQASDQSTYSVTQPMPVIESFAADSTTIPYGGFTAVRFTTRHAASWTLQSSRTHGFFPSSGTGAGAFTSRYERNFGDCVGGDDVVTLEVTGLDGSSVASQLTMRYPPPTIPSFTADRYTVPFNEATTIRLTVANAATWRLLSSRGNTISIPTGNCPGTRVTQYLRDVAAGDDVITLEVSGLNGSVITSQFTIK